MIFGIWIFPELGVAGAALSTVFAVAAYGIATRLEYFFLAALQALVTIMPVYIGQNFGAKQFNRIKEGVKIAAKFSIIYGIIAYIILFIAARPIATFFSNTQEVIDVVVLYMRIVPLGYGLQGIGLLVTGTLNALQKPIQAASINLVQMLLLYVPLAILLSSIMSVSGLFTALLISYLITSVLAYYLLIQAYRFHKFA